MGEGASMHELTSEELACVKKLELHVLDELKRVCQLLSIQFYLDAGTLLGAVRHQGFIPWDDDIDVCMMREAYNKLMQDGPGVISDDFFLQTPYNSPGMPASFMKLRLNGTVMQELLVDESSGHQGIWIDIFPFDYVPKDTDLERLRFREQFLCKCFDLRQRSRSSVDAPFWKVGIRKLLHLLLLLIPRRFILSRMELPVPHDCKSDYLVTCLHYGVSFFYLEACESFPPLELIFEGEKFYALANYNDYLTQIYGDWFSLPPAEERVPHHLVSKFDLGKYAAK